MAQTDSAATPQAAYFCSFTAENLLRVCNEITETYHAGNVLYWTQWLTSWQFVFDSKRWNRSWMSGCGDCLRRPRVPPSVSAATRWCRGQPASRAVPLSREARNSENRPRKAWAGYAVPAVAARRRWIKTAR